MLATAPVSWSERLAWTLTRYDEELLRLVVGRLVRPRSHWPVEELIERSVSTVENPAVIDRRLQDLEPVGRQLLGLLAHSRQMQWRLGNLVELLLALGHPDGLAPLFTLMEAGLLYPVLSPTQTVGLRSFEQWLGQAGAAGLMVFAHPAVAARAMNQDLGLPELRSTEMPLGAPVSADGLEWPMRLTALWQQVAEMPLRRTQNCTFFKRDLDRLRGEPALNAAPTEAVVEIPDLALLAVALGEGLGIVCEAESELRAGPLPENWDEGLGRTLEGFFHALFHLRTWEPRNGFQILTEGVGDPFPSAYLLVFLLLGRLQPEAWAQPEELEAWLMAHHPYWAAEDMRPSKSRPWLTVFLLGVTHTLGLTQAARTSEGTWLTRLSPYGRWLLGLAEPPSPPAPFPHTLLVQPNLELLVYRQGLNPGLVARLARLARWKTLGAACTMQLSPESVYRALESGMTFESILRTLEQHGTRAVPQPVINSLRTWAQKRDRITVYPGAALLEFSSPEELNEALARGIPAVRITDRLALVPHDDAIDYKHFRLTGTRDYSLPADRCVTVEADGVTLSVDSTRSDLLLETELPRFSVPLDRSVTNGRRQYRLTPGSLAGARQGGMNATALELWFQQRTGGVLTPAARLLLTANQLPPVEVRRHLVLHVASVEIADGLNQLPQTRELLEERLGATALVVAQENLAALRAQLALLGIRFSEEGVQD